MAVYELTEEEKCELFGVLRAYYAEWGKMAKKFSERALKIMEQNNGEIILSELERRMANGRCRLTSGVFWKETIAAMAYLYYTSKVELVGKADFVKPISTSIWKIKKR